MASNHDHRITTRPEVDARLFTIFALANVAGYNSDNGWEYGHVRQAVRIELAGRSNYWRSTLHEAGLLRSVQRSGGATLMDLMVSLSQPPELALVPAPPLYTAWQAESRSSLKGLESILRDFVQREPIMALWSRLRPEYEKAAQTFAAVSQKLHDVAVRLDGPCAAGALDILLLPNLLDAAGRGYSLSAPERTWLFFGPARNAMQAGEVGVHELIHRWTDPVCEAQLQFEDHRDPMPNAKAKFRIVAELYPDFPIWVSETIVRAATAWLIPELEYVEVQGTVELLEYYERIGFLGVTDAYQLFATRGESNFLEVLNESIAVVRQAALHECT
jgi:hypothetical protein